MKITKDKLDLLIKDVVLPFEKYILDNAIFKEQMQDDEKRAKHNIAIAKLSIMLLNDLVGAKELFFKGSQAHKELQISTQDMQKYLSIFFKLHNDWVAKYIEVDKFHKELMQKFDAMFAKAYDYEEDNFLMFDSEEIDEAIEKMHYEDHKKITAVEYASYEEILDDDLSSIIELKDELEHTLVMHEKIDDEFLVSLGRELHKLSGVLFSTSEFKDVGYALENFTSELKNLDLNSLDTLSEELAFALLSQMNEDLQKWIESVFIKQDAVDIHYGDASFLANIAQFSIMLEHNSSSDDESDDDFLF